MTRRLGDYLLTAGLAAFCLFCTPVPVAGPSTEEGNPQIVAIVIDNNQPVNGAIVKAYRISSYSDTSQAPSGATSVAAGQTDKHGRIAFDSLAAGTYAIEATDLQTSRSAMSSRITIEDSSSKSQTDTLLLGTPGTIRGVVTRGGIPGVVPSQNTVLRDGAIMVIIQELEVSPRLTPQNGTYRFTSLPPGTYTILYYATDGFFSARRTATVVAGDTAVIDTVTLRPVPRLLPPKGFQLSYPDSGTSNDSDIVRLSWQKLDFDSLRWYEVERIDLAGSFDKTFQVTDTALADTVEALPAGTTLNYVIRSVDRAFNRSANAGPLEVVVR
jgi:hypothetical protein